MKRIIKYFITILLSICFGYSQSLEETIESMAKTNTQGYLGPMVTAFGMGMNSGTFQNAKPHSLLGFDFKMGLSLTSITDAGKTFDFVLPDADIDVDIVIEGTPTTISVNPNDIYESDRTSSTMCGEATSNSIAVDNTKLKNTIIAQLAYNLGIDEATISITYDSEINTAVNDAGISAISTPVGFNLAMVPMTIPQLSIGLPKHIELTLRGMKAIDLGDLGELSFFGFGGKIGLNQFIPLPNIVLPNFAVGYYVTNFEIGNIMTMKNSIATLQVSKSIPFLTVYGGFGLESSSLDIDYTYTDDTDETSTVVPVKFSLDGENKFRSTMAQDLNLRL